MVTLFAFVWVECRHPVNRQVCVCMCVWEQGNQTFHLIKFNQNVVCVCSSASKCLYNYTFWQFSRHSCAELAAALNARPKKSSHPTKLYQEATFFTLCAPELVFPMRMSPCNASSLNRSVCGLLRTAIAWLPSKHTHICFRSTCSSNLSNSYFSALRKLIDAEYERESTAQKQRDQKQKVFEQKPFHGALAVKRNRLLPHSDSVVYNNT